MSKRRGAARRQTHRERGEGRPRDLLPVLVRALGRGGADDELRRARVGARGAASAQAQRREPDERGARHLIPDDCPVVGSRNARAGTRRTRQTQRSGTSTAPRPIDRLKAPGEIHPGTWARARNLGGRDGSRIRYALSSLSFLISDFSFSRLLSDGRSTMLNTFLPGPKQYFHGGSSQLYRRLPLAGAGHPAPRADGTTRRYRRGPRNRRPLSRASVRVPSSTPVAPRLASGRSLVHPNDTRDNKPLPRPPRARDARGIDRAGEASRRRVSRGARRAFVPSRATRAVTARRLPFRGPRGWFRVAPTPR